VPELFCLPQWPAGQKKISIPEAAELIKQILPSCPLSKDTDGELRQTLISLTHGIDVADEIVGYARSAGIGLIHPVLGIPSSVYWERDCFIDEEAFGKVFNHFMGVLNRTRGMIAPKKRPGPAPGAVDRFAKSDRAVYSDFEALTNPTNHNERKMSRTEASLKLADDRKILGSGTTESRAKRFRERYRKDKEQSRN
jgi:hypothetical protein